MGAGRTWPPFASTRAARQRRTERGRGRIKGATSLLVRHAVPVMPILTFYRDYNTSTLPSETWQRCKMTDDSQYRESR